MSGAILLMILNFIGLGGGPTLVGTLSTNFATRRRSRRHGRSAPQAPPACSEALVWMTPFFARGRVLPAASGDGDQPRGQGWRARARWRLRGRHPACRRRPRGPLSALPGSRLRRGMVDFSRLRNSVASSWWTRSTRRSASSSRCRDGVRGLGLWLLVLSLTRTDKAERQPSGVHGLFELTQRPRARQIWRAAFAASRLPFGTRCITGAPRRRGSRERPMIDFRKSAALVAALARAGALQPASRPRRRRRRPPPRQRRTSR